MADRWKEQWARVERYYGRLHAARFGELPQELLWTPEARASFHDDMYSFFLHAFHLREWLAADGILVNSEFSSSRVLGLCADIANAAKHVELTSPRIGQPRKEHAAVSLIVKGREVRLGTDVVLSLDGRHFSGFGFAKQVRAEWVRILQERKLSPELQHAEEATLRWLRPVPDSAVRPERGEGDFNGLAE